MAITVGQGVTSYSQHAAAQPLRSALLAEIDAAANAASVT
jgi:hypothetical protein